MAYDSDLKRMVVFGGRQAASGPHFGDLWEWDTVQGAWNQRTPGDVSRRLAVPTIVGARDGLRPGPQEDVHVQRLAAGRGLLSRRSMGVGRRRADVDRTRGCRPRSRRPASAPGWSGTAAATARSCSVDSTRRWGACNDTWEWDGTAWTAVTPAGTKPTPRHSAMIAYDAAPREGGPLQRQHRHRGRNRRDLGRRAVGVGRRRGDLDADHRAAVDEHAVLSGYTKLVYDAGQQQDRPLLRLEQRLGVHRGHDRTGTWADAAPCRPRSTPHPPTTPPASSTTPASRRWWCSAARPRARALWELNTADYTWVNRSAPANGPIQRQYPSLAFDSRRGKLMVFGGRSSIDNLYKQDIWEWSGTARC